jgi:hypothetical protein
MMKTFDAIFKFGRLNFQLNVSFAVDRSELFSYESHVLYLYRKTFSDENKKNFSHIEKSFFAVLLCVFFFDCVSFSGKEKLRSEETLLVQDIIIVSIVHSTLFGELYTRWGTSRTRTLFSVWFTRLERGQCGFDVV